MAFVDVRDEKTKKLLFRFDPDHDVVEIADRRERIIVFLADYRPGGRLAPPETLMGRPCEWPPVTTR